MAQQGMSGLGSVGNLILEKLPPPTVTPTSSSCAHRRATTSSSCSFMLGAQPCSVCTALPTAAASCTEV